MNETWSQITEALSQIGGEDSALRGGLLVGTGAVAASSLGLSLWRWLRGKPDAKQEPKQEKRVKVDIDAPEGTVLVLRVNDDS